MSSTSFEEFFAAATGRAPLDYQRRLAADGLPESLTVPPGTGRTGVVLAWLWRRLHATGQVRDSTPRRLFYVLPQASLTEPVADEVAGWLTRLGLDQRVALMPSGNGVRQWRRDMHCPAIVIGTADALVSKALNRGYGVGRVIHPIDFALATNGAQWVFDEVGLCPRSAATLGRIASLAAYAGTAEPFGVTFLASAEASDSPVAARLGAEPGDYPAIAVAAAGLHRPGRRTLIVLNSVAAAQRVHAALAGGSAECVLVHAEFRGRERRALVEAALAEPAGDRGQIVVATAIVDAGLEITAELVMTEVAPGASLSLREGRCEPGGRLFWVPGGGTGLREPGFNRQGAFTPEEIFNTPTAGTTGEDLDVAGLVGDSDDLEAQVIWASWAQGGPPPEEFRLPGEEWRCRAPLARVTDLARRVAVWRLGSEGWGALTPGEEPGRPGEILVVAAADGGYDPVLGFDPALPGPVAECPSLDLVAETEAEPGEWVSLTQHSEETRDQAAALLSVIRPSLSEVEWRSVVCAAYLHDVGKAHPTWQDALCGVAAEADQERVQAGRPWAKSGTEGRLVFAGDVSFKHELASLLLVDGPLRGLVDGGADLNLVRYLVLAHHGRLRVRVFDPEAEGSVLFGLTDGGSWPVPAVLGVGSGKLTVDLAQFSGAWTTTVLSLLERYGPFVLAYTETLVRIADWRSSGRNELAVAVG